MSITLWSIHFLFHVVHLSNSRFFKYNSSFLARFLLCSITFTRFALFKTTIESNGNTGSNVTCRRKLHFREEMHKGLWKNKRHLNTWVWETFKQSRSWNASTLCTIFLPHSWKVGSGCMMREIMKWSSLWIHGFERMSKNFQYSGKYSSMSNLKKAQKYTWSLCYCKNRISRSKFMVLPQQSSFFPPRNVGPYCPTFHMSEWLECGHLDSFERSVIGHVRPHSLEIDLSCILICPFGQLAEILGLKLECLWHHLQRWRTIHSQYTCIHIRFTKRVHEVQSFIVNFVGIPNL